MKIRPYLVSAETLKRLLDYDPATGAFVWKARTPDLTPPWSKRSREWEANRFNAAYAGKPALTTKKPVGYLFGGIMGVNVYAHRAAWAITHGEWPAGEIDHINGDKSDNRIANLRDTSKSMNMKNVPRSRRNTSGHPGVTKCGRTRKWVARIQVGGKTVTIGRFDCLDQAARARREAETENGYHPNHGRVGSNG